VPAAQQQLLQLVLKQHQGVLRGEHFDTGVMTLLNSMDAHVAVYALRRLLRKPTARLKGVRNMPAYLQGIFTVLMREHC
jgi:hypothetical protein